MSNPIKHALLAEVIRPTEVRESLLTVAGSRGVTTLPERHADVLLRHRLITIAKGVRKGMRKCWPTPAGIVVAQQATDWRVNVLRVATEVRHNPELANGLRLPDCAEGRVSRQLVAMGLIDEDRWSVRTALGRDVLVELLERLAVLEHATATHEG